MILLELFNSKYDWHWQSTVTGDIYIAKFTDKFDKTIDFIASFDEYSSHWEVVFKRDKSTNTTGEGDAFAIFSTVSDILTDFIKKEKPKVIQITAEKRIINTNTVSNSRIKLYTKGLEIISKKLGYTLRTMPSTVDTIFFMRRNNLSESFGNSAGNMSPLTYQGNAAWHNEKDFFKKWFSLPYMTNGYTNQSVSEDKISEIEIFNMGDTFSVKNTKSVFDLIKNGKFIGKVNNFNVKVFQTPLQFILGIDDTAFLQIDKEAGSNFWVLTYSYVNKKFRGSNLRNKLIELALKKLNISELFSDNALSAESAKKWLDLGNSNLTLFRWDANEYSYRPYNELSDREKSDIFLDLEKKFNKLTSGTQEEANRFRFMIREGIVKKNKLGMNISLPKTLLPENIKNEHTYKMLCNRLKIPERNINYKNYKRIIVEELKNRTIKRDIFENFKIPNGDIKFVIYKNTSDVVITELNEHSVTHLGEIIGMFNTNKNFINNIASWYKLQGIKVNYLIEDDTTPILLKNNSNQSVSEDAELKVTDEMIRDKIRKVLKKYKITFAELKPILAKGQKTEFEHTNNNQVAKNIALDHIAEFLDYYDRLEKVEEVTTRTTKNGGAGTLKAKITKQYGGGVTCDKAKKLKTRKNATAHDKSQANWFLNMNCKENQLDEIELTNSTYSDNYVTNTFNNLKKVKYKKKYQGYDIHTGIFNDLILIGIIDVAYILIYEKDNFNILGNSFVSPDFRGKNIKNLLIKFAIDELKLSPLVSDDFLTKNSLNSWLKLSAMNFDLKIINWGTKEISNISNKNYLDKNSRFIIEENQMLQKLSNTRIGSSKNRTNSIEKLCKNFNVKLGYNIPLNESIYDHIGRKFKEKINIYNELNSNIGKNYLIYETTCKFLKNKEIKIYEYNHNTIDDIVRNETKPISKIFGVAKNNFNNIKLFLKLSEDGRIVKGVNTTIDVDVDGTQKQAKKFGNDVSWDGVPAYSFSDSVKIAGKIK